VLLKLSLIVDERVQAAKDAMNEYLEEGLYGEGRKENHLAAI
jgi:hypothetical protein